MSRPTLPLNTWGKVTRTRIDAHTWEAIARYRDSDGVTRRIRRQGTTATQAEHALLSAMRDRQQTVGTDLTAESRVVDLAERWLAEIEDSDRAVQTKRAYAHTVEAKVLPALGAVRLREASVPRVDRFLTTVHDKSGPSVAKRCRVVLLGMFALAVRHGAAATNPVRDARTVRVRKQEVQVLTVEEVAVLRQRLHEWDARRTTTHTSDLAQVVDVLLATGCRTGEVLAIRWKDLDLDLTSPSVTISGTIIDGVGGLVRQDNPKSDSSYRRLRLPDSTAAMLRERKADSHTVVVFPSSVGTLRSPSNFRRSWRQFREVYGYPDWITPKTMRKTVATLLRDEVDIAAASLQLGHSSSTVTKAHYAKRVHEAPDQTAVLDRLTA